MRHVVLLTQNITFYIFTISEFLFHQNKTVKKKIKDCANRMQLHSGTETFSSLCISL